MSRYFNQNEGQWLTISSNIALVNSEKLLIDVSNGSIVVQMNPTPGIGETIEVAHFAGDIVSNPIIIDPLLNKIDNVLGTKIIQQPHFEMRLVYDGIDWISSVAEDTLESVVSRNGLTSHPIKIQNGTPSTSIDNGALVVSGGVGIGGDVNISGNLHVHGSTLTSTSTVVNVDSPVMLLGGVSSNTVDDNKDRGIEYKWNDGVSGKIGFFGLDDSSGKFTFIPNAQNFNNIYSGEIGEIDAHLDWMNVNSKPNTLIGYGITTRYAEINSTNSFNANQNGNGHELNNWVFRGSSSAFYDKGTIGSGTVQFDYTQSQYQRVQVYNAIQLQVINWPSTGTWGRILIELVNGASATITWPIINWICPDGSITNNISYSGIYLQLNGTDWVELWTRNGGATVFGKIIR